MGFCTTYFSGFKLNKIYGVEESYDFLTSIGLLDQESPSPWIPSIPAYIYNAATFGIMTLFIWGHGVIGLHRHLRFKSIFYNKNFIRSNIKNLRSYLRSYISSVISFEAREIKIITKTQTSQTKLILKPNVRGCA